MEEHFSGMYAKLCRTLTDCWSAPSAEGTEGQEGQKIGKDFRLKLLTRCVVAILGDIIELSMYLPVRVLRRCQEEFDMDREAAVNKIKAVSIFSYVCFLNFLILNISL